MESKQNLPAGWRWVKLKEIGPIKDGDWILNSDYALSGVRLLQVGDIGVGKFIGKSSRYISIDRAKELKCKFLKTGDILIARLPDPIGRACLLPDLGYLCITAVDVSIWRPNPDLAERQYLTWYLNSSEWFNKVKNLSSGSTRSRISRLNLENIKIPLPPLSEQKRIAAKLKEMMNEVDNARLACEKQLEAANALPSAYLREVFESPEAHNWPKKRLGEVCKIITGSTPRTDDDSNWDGEILWATPSDMGKITGFTIEDTERKISEKGLKSCSTNLLPAGSILLTTRAPIGNIAVNLKPMCTNQGFKSFIPSSQIHNWFLFFTLKYSIPALQSMGRGQTFTEISKAQVGNFLIPLPPLSEQKRIAEHLKEKITQAEKLQAAIEKELATINSLPQSILSKAFRGEL